MTKVGVLVVVVVALAACSKAKDKQGPAAAPPPVAGAAGACDRMLSAEFRAKYLPNATIENGPAGIPQAANCKFKMGTKSGQINITCIDGAKSGMAEVLSTVKATFPDMKDAPGIGSGAVIMDTGLGSHQVTAFDSDSDCKVSLMLPDAIDATAFANDLLASLPPK